MPLLTSGHLAGAAIWKYYYGMIQAVQGQARYQVFMDDALPGHFEFVAGFAKIKEAEQHAGQLHAEYHYSDVVILDAVQGTLMMTLPGSRTLSGKTV